MILIVFDFTKLKNHTTPGENQHFRWTYVKALVTGLVIGFLAGPFMKETKATDPPKVTSSFELKLQTELDDCVTASYFGFTPFLTDCVNKVAKRANAGNCVLTSDVYNFAGFSQYSLVNFINLKFHRTVLHYSSLREIEHHKVYH